MKKILLIGDSIREGYDKYVKKAFDGVAEVVYPRENCRFSGYIIRSLTLWQKDLGLTDDIDLVHFNAGLWDDLVMLDGKNHTSIKVYEENIDRICTILKIMFPRAKLIFATSTPVQEELFFELKRYNKDTEAYNAVAVEVIKKHGGSINDLYAITKDMPKSYYSDLTHLYTKEGTELLTNQVVKVIEEALDIKGKALDYDALFGEKTKVLGV